MRVFIVLNPVAGRTRADDVKEALRRHLGRLKWRLDIYETTGQESVAEVVRSAVNNGAGMILAAGGDGTVSAAVDGLVHSKVPLGIIPTGTSNVLAQELRIPLSFEKACRMLSGRTTTRAIDALQVGQRYFVLSIGTGLDAMAMEGTGRKEKRRFGPLAYVWTVVKLAFGVQPRVFTIVADGRTMRVRAADVLLTNVSTLTRPLRWGPHIYPDDGRIDICIMRMRNPLDVLHVIWEIIMPGVPRRDRNLRYWSAEHAILVFADRPVPVQGDGDLMGETPIEARVVPAAVRVLVPDEPQSKRWPPLPMLRSSG